MSSIVGLVVTLAMTVWIYLVVKKHDGQMPWLWAAGTLVFWPLVITIAGFEYDVFAMKVVGVSGLGLTVLGLVITIGFVGLAVFT